MRAYRCYFLNTIGRIGAVEEISRAGDEEAGQIATNVLAGQSHHNIVKVWDRDRMVSRNSKTSN